MSYYQFLKLLIKKKNLVYIYFLNYFKEFEPFNFGYIINIYVYGLI